MPFHFYIQWAIATTSSLPHLPPPPRCLQCCGEVRAMGQVLARARDVHYDGTSMVKKLRAMVHSAEEQVGTRTFAAGHLG